ncbi:MAG: hypothetical protein HY267_03115 [Deltaproteobacteria bacterium]|nr:hypothetical protein [Deltaproteobacteria bacterium]
MPTVRIEPNYKVTIPEDARDSLGLQVSEEVETITHKDSITFRRTKPARSYTPTKRELTAIEKGRAEIKKGNSYTLDELRTSLKGTPAHLVQKRLARASKPDREWLLKALADMATDPFAGDVLPLKGQQNTFRRRVGDWRIFLTLTVNSSVLI